VRKRQPLPPQDEEFREAGRVRPEVSNQRPRDLPPSQSPLTFHGWKKTDREIDGSLQQYEVHRIYPRREDTHEDGYNQPSSGFRDSASGYDRGHEQDRPRVWQRGDNLMNQDRNYGVAVETLPPAHDSRLAYQDQERDPPSKPRAMHQDSTYVIPGPLSTSLPASLPQSAIRYRDRSSPPHLSRSESRQESDPHPGSTLPVVWQESRADKPQVRPDRPVCCCSLHVFELATKKNRLPMNFEDVKLQHQAQIVYRLVYERFILGSRSLPIHQIPRTIGHRFRLLMFLKRETMTRNTQGSISRRLFLGWACSIFWYLAF